MCPGQERVTTRLPSVAPSSTLPSASTISSATPKKGLVAEPGFRSVAPGNGAIMAAPVSVCHQVSMIGQRPSPGTRSEEHTSELQSLMRISYAVFCLKKKIHEDRN